MKYILGTCLITASCLIAACSSEPADVTAEVRSSLDAANLSAVSVEQDRAAGTVTLHGTVMTADDKARAESVAMAQAPGQTVVNAIEVQPAMASGSAPDAWVTMKTKIALMTNDGVSTSDLNVDTVAGMVTLHGTVPSDAEKTTAESVARTIDGVRGVENLLQVVPESRREVVERSDAQVKEGVEAAFKANERIDGSGVEVASVNDGVVLLSGSTESIEAHLESVEVARAVRGVRRVSTEVEVDPAS